MPAWVFDSHRLFYAQLMPVHERSNAPVAKNVKSCLSSADVWGRIHYAFLRDCFNSYELRRYILDQSFGHL